ncbi:hypothetical protein COCOBI_15-1930 [Coccomyxa sp. Obi]|nr:hypothetical protein COCOBI_15-1930 [Coccomyxa sp. Obi]
MGRWIQEYSTLAPTSEVDPHRPPTHLLEELGGSTGSDVSTATVHDGDSEAGTQKSGGDILAGLLAQEMSTDIDSECDYDTEEEEIAAKFGEEIWIQDEYLDDLRPPKEMDILLFRNGMPGGNYEWMASAPEWHNALGFGSSSERASEDLQSKLVETKEFLIDCKVASGVKVVPLAPCRKDALMACRNWLKSYYEGMAKDSRDVKCGKIRV